VLAAGRGTRFGTDKLLAPLGARPLLAHALEAAARARRTGSVSGVLAVVPAGSEPLLTLARAAGAEPVANDDPAAGLGRSVRLGVARAAALLPPEERAAIVVLLGDQPGVTPETIGALVEAWRGGAGPVVRPRYAAAPDMPGHPLLLDRAAWALAASLEGDTGFGPLLASGRLALTHVDRPGRNPDVDTPSDLAAFEESP
jgi:molybdenum cofactor cytidylyltransferase